jgi:hypothetical protein
MDAALVAVLFEPGLRLDRPIGTAWKLDTYPSIVAAAKCAKAEIYFWDE